ncbi:hypothetical protein [Spiroplasma endosymbiont of Polydrusus pterygomalis]|uniref:hypothetical protein n=1 Tax=Spiroplasma endosymbiont of Polydrusus pterygomalis TaxID=3139327 RepID=UPI003CCB3051
MNKRVPRKQNPLWKKDYKKCSVCKKKQIMSLTALSLINDDWQKNIIELATYETLLKKNEIKENINYEKELIQGI